MSSSNLNEIKENLSFSYLHAVTSRAGGICAAASRGEDNRGADARLTFNTNGIMKKVNLDVQLKATSKELTTSNGKISYSIPVKQYRKYTQKSNTPLLFVLFCLPEIQDDWLSLTENEVILKKCAYWTGLLNAPECDKYNITIYIPQKNLLNIEQITNIVADISNGKELNYEQ